MRSRTPLVGRESELLELRDAATQARSGKPCAVFLHGEPGVGKTRAIGLGAEPLIEDLEGLAMQARISSFTWTMGAGGPCGPS